VAVVGRAGRGGARHEPVAELTSADKDDLPGRDRCSKRLPSGLPMGTGDPPPEAVPRR
jgi:hypothetical protein